MRHCSQKVLPFAWLLFCAIGACGAREPVTADDRCRAHRDNGYEALYGANVFASAHEGQGGDYTPREVEALRCMTRAPDAVELLRVLAQRGSLPGQLYALVGMRVLDQAEFERLLPRYAADESIVRTHAGDMAGTRRVAELARELRGTYHVKDLLPELYPRVAMPEPGFEVILPDAQGRLPADVAPQPK